MWMRWKKGNLFPRSSNLVYPRSVQELIVFCIMSAWPHQTKNSVHFFFVRIKDEKSNIHPYPHQKWYFHMSSMVANIFFILWNLNFWPELEHIQKSLSNHALSLSKCNELNGKNRAVGMEVKGNLFILFALLWLDWHTWISIPCTFLVTTNKRGVTPYPGVHAVARWFNSLLYRFTSQLRERKAAVKA